MDEIVWVFAAIRDNTIDAFAIYDSEKRAKEKMRNYLIDYSNLSLDRIREVVNEGTVNLKDGRAYVSIMGNLSKW